MRSSVYRRTNTPVARELKLEMTDREKRVKVMMDSRNEEFTDRLSLR
jgi:hypothetical protein